MPSRSLPAWMRAALLLTAVLSLVSLAGVGWLLAETGRLRDEMSVLSRPSPKSPRVADAHPAPAAAPNAPAPALAGDLPAQVGGLRTDLRALAEEARAEDEALAAVRTRLDAAGKASEKGGQSQMIDSLMEMGLKQEVGRIKSRLKLRPEQVEAVRKIYEETFSKFKDVFARYFEGDEEVYENEQKYQAEFEDEQKKIFDRITPLLDHAQLVEFDKFRQEKEKEREIRVKAGKGE